MALHKDLTLMNEKKCFEFIDYLLSVNMDVNIGIFHNGETDILSRFSSTWNNKSQVIVCDLQSRSSLRALATEFDVGYFVNIDNIPQQDFDVLRSRVSSRNAGMIDCNGVSAGMIYGS